MDLTVITKEELKDLLISTYKEVLNSKFDLKQDQKVEELLDKKQTAKLLKVSLATVDNYRRNGIIPSYKIGSKVRFKKSEILKAITSSNH